jgi:hypothetical protein
MEDDMTRPDTITPETLAAARALDAAYAACTEAARKLARSKIEYERRRADRDESRLAVRDAERALSDAEREARQ